MHRSRFSLANLMVLLAVLAANAPGFAQCQGYKDYCEAAGRFCVASPVSLDTVDGNFIPWGGFSEGSACGFRPCWDFFCECGEAQVNDTCLDRAEAPEERSKRLQAIVLSVQRQIELYGVAGEQLVTPALRGVVPPRLGGERLTRAEQRSLRSLCARWKQLWSVSVDASVLTALPGAEGSDSGNVEIREQGDSFRMSVALAGTSMLGGGFEAAFDGASYQLMGRAQGVLTLQSRPWPRLPRTLPNPVLLAIWPLAGYDLGCTTCDLSLSALRSIDTAFLSETARVESRTARTTTLLLPGAADDKQGEYFRVLMDTDEGRVLSLARVGEAGVSRIEIEFSYDPVPGSAPTFIPSAVSFRSLELGSVAAATFRMSRLNVDEQLAPTDFTIASEKARIIVDADSALLLKHPQLAN